MSGREQEMSIPLATREEIIARDGHCCRLCGLWCERVHVHHLVYRSQGGKNTAANLVSLDLKCHEVVHSNKPLWMPILQQVAVTPGVNGLQLLRWYERKARSGL